MDRETGSIEVVDASSETDPWVYHQPFDNSGHLSALAILALAERDIEFLTRQGKASADHLEGCEACQADLHAVNDQNSVLN